MLHKKNLLSLSLSQKDGSTSVFYLYTILGANNSTCLEVFVS